MYNHLTQTEDAEFFEQNAVWLAQEASSYLEREREKKEREEEERRERDKQKEDEEEAESSRS